MLRVGFALNLLGVLIIAAAVGLIGPLVTG
jgi:hypothetical protein